MRTQTSFEPISLTEGTQNYHQILDLHNERSRKKEINKEERDVQTKECYKDVPRRLNRIINHRRRHCGLISIFTTRNHSRNKE